jgi:nicotinate-nucleotide adenylyltransferase
VKTGLYFGTFNPVHIGHLAIAGYMAQFTDLDQVWMVVSPHNPLKEKKSLLKDYHRLAMLKAAIEEYSYLKASDVEFHLPIPSYTVNTLAHLEEKYPAHHFSLIVGSDNLETLTKWKNHEVILDRYDLYVYPRPGHEGGLLRNHPRVHWMAEAPLLEISATFIRESVHRKKDIRFLMPEKAWEYMCEMHFYER